MKRFFPYYIFKFSFDLILVYPFYALMFQNRGQSESSIGWLLTLWSVSVVLLELPMGVLSDRLSRRKLLFAAAITKAAAFVVWIPARSFAAFTAGFVVWGLSEALLSGTEEAWLYESLVHRKRDHDYQKIKGRGAFFASTAIGTSSIFGGFGMQYGESFILSLSALACLVSSGTVFFFENPPRTAGPEDEEDSGEKFIPMVRSAFTDILRSRRLLILTVFASFVLILSGVLEEWDPIFLTSLGITPVYLGFWLAIRYACESLGALTAHRFNRFMPGIRSMIVIAAVASLALPALGYFRSLMLLPLYGIYYAVYAMLAVQTEGKMQEVIPGSRRATVMSVKSLLDNLVGIMIILGAGYLAESRSWPVVWMATGFGVTGICLVLFFTVKKRES